ncbi:MAG: hypothetical protein HY735_05910 [Verrucomicrobia bacterium]|nr:hypothetical protein [Verrucomicrobiota bacterium]
MSEIPVQPPSRAKQSQSPWAKATAWMVIVFLFLAASVYVFRSLRTLPGDAVDKTAEVVEKVGDALKDILSAFNQGTITTSFVSYAASLSANHYLQFATLRQSEVFTRKDEATTGFGYIPLPDVIVEARAPVAYTYYIDFNAKWDLVLKDEIIYVLAPPIQFNEPAVDASEINYEVRKGSMFRKTKQAKENLKKSIMPMVQRRAKENVGLVRETGRKEVADFVEKWLARSFVDGNKFPVKVYFADEELPANLTAVPTVKKPSD